MSHPTELPPVPDTPSSGSLWRHRNGTVYRVVVVARVEATLDPVVVYTTVGTGAARDCWVHPHAEFMDGRFTPYVRGTWHAVKRRVAASA